MGWLWTSTEAASPSNSPPSNASPSQSSSFAAEPSDQRTSSSSTPDLAQPPRDSSTTATSDRSAPGTPVPRTRDQTANDEVLAFFRQLAEERRRASEPPLSPQDDDDDDDDDDDPDDDPPELMTPARLYNTHSKCLRLFDAAFYCSSPAGHFMNVYRYGTVRQCGQLWSDILWCMRTNRGFLTSQQREQRTMRHAWQRERDRLKERGGCAEEVWGEGRRWVVEGAFQADWEGEESPFRRGEGGGL